MCLYKMGYRLDQFSVVRIIQANSRAKKERSYGLYTERCT
jgi:hypothetical protein